MRLKKERAQKWNAKKKPISNFVTAMAVLIQVAASAAFVVNVFSHM